MVLDLQSLPEKARERVLDLYRRERARPLIPAAYEEARAEHGSEGALYEVAERFGVTPRFVRWVAREGG